jgi:hypothetical protein
MILTAITHPLQVSRQDRKAAGSSPHHPNLLARHADRILISSIMYKAMRLRRSSQRPRTVAIIRRRLRVLLSPARVHDSPEGVAVLVWIDVPDCSAVPGAMAIRPAPSRRFPRYELVDRSGTTTYPTGTRLSPCESVVSLMRRLVHYREGSQALHFHSRNLRSLFTTVAIPAIALEQLDKSHEEQQAYGRTRW